MSDPLSWIASALEDLKGRDLLRRLAERHGPQSGAVQLDDRRLVNFGGNDYLGLANSRELTEAVKSSLSEYGWGSGASPLLSGRSSAHVLLEQRLAEFENVDAALFFSSGYAANYGAITSLVGRGDAIFSDQRNHASIIDGCRLSGAHVHVYPHNDVDALRQMLAVETAARRRLIVTDGLFSMDGDLAPVSSLAELARQFEAMLMVDEAHATGVFGASGRGVCEYQNAEDGVHIRGGTLSKALGSIGGFVAGRRDLIELLSNRARSYFFSTAPPAAVAMAGVAALQLVNQQPERRQQLLKTAEHLRGRLSQLGFHIGESQSQIVPIIVGEPDAAMQLAKRLLDRGFYAPGIRPPSVPTGRALLRISLSYAHGESDVEGLLDALRASMK